MSPLIMAAGAATFQIDWTIIILAVIAAVPTWAALAGKKASVEGKRESVAAAQEAKKASKETHEAVNHRMDAFLSELAKSNAEILKTAIAEARAEGIKQTEDTIKAVALTVKNDVPKKPVEAEANPKEVKEPKKKP